MSRPYCAGRSRMSELTHLSLFSGIGGLAAEWEGK